MNDTLCNSIAFLDNLGMGKTNINVLVQSIERSYIQYTKIDFQLNNTNSIKRKLKTSIDSFNSDTLRWSSLQVSLLLAKMKPCL